MKRAGIVILPSVALLSLQLAQGIERPEEEGTDALNESSIQELLPPPREIAPPELPSEKSIEDIAWLGVRGSALDQLLRVHLKLESGLVLQVISPESPAAKAGLKEGDILLRFNKREIRDQQALREAVRACQKEQVVPVELIQKGVRKTLEVQLEGRPIIERNTERMRSFNELMDGEDKIHPKTLQKKDRSVFGQMLEKFGLNNILDQVAPSLEWNMNFKSNASMRYFDNDGSIELNTLDDQSRHVIVKDRGGKVQYEGAWNTEEDKMLAPPEVRQRIEELNF